MVKENEDLRSLLESDDEADYEMMEKLNKRIAELQEENKELYSGLSLLEAQIEMAGNNPTIATSRNQLNQFDSSIKDSHDQSKPNSIPSKLDLLRQRINQLVGENDDLKSTIARLRWSKQMQETVDNDDDESIDVASLEKQLDNLRDMLELEQSESKKWKQMYEDIKAKTMETEKNKQNEALISDWLVNFTDMLKEGLVTGSAAFGQRVKNILETVTKSSVVLTDELNHGINMTQEIIANLNDRLQNKWRELQNIKIVNEDQKLTSKMAKLLENTIQKIQQASEKFSTNTRPFSTRIKQFSAKINKLILNLDSKWDHLMNKAFGKSEKSKSDQSEFDQSKSGQDNVDDNQGDSNWIFERANARRKNLKNDLNENWVFERARDREIQRINLDDHEKIKENWFLKRRHKFNSKRFNDYHNLKSDHENMRNHLEDDESYVNRKTNRFSKQR